MALPNLSCMPTGTIFMRPIVPDVCSICFEPLFGREGTEPGTEADTWLDGTPEQWRLRPAVDGRKGVVAMRHCAHMFHVHCMRDYIVQAQARAIMMRCPQCSSPDSVSPEIVHDVLHSYDMAIEIAKRQGHLSKTVNILQGFMEAETVIKERMTSIAQEMGALSRNEDRFERNEARKLEYRQTMSDWLDTNEVENERLRDRQRAWAPLRTAALALITKINTEWRTLEEGSENKLAWLKARLHEARPTSERMMALQTEMRTLLRGMEETLQNAKASAERIRRDQFLEDQDRMYESRLYVDA